MVETMYSDHGIAPVTGSIHPASKARMAMGADSDRRKLSIIFQRPTTGTVVGWPFGLRARPKIHGSNCQSPRAQRCWRAAATS